MSLSFAVPQSARYIAANYVFTGPFNPPSAPGMFDFGPATQNGTLLTPLQPNTVYLLERMAVSGDIAAEDYNGALDLIHIPTIFIKRRMPFSPASELVYVKGIPIAEYSDNRECSAFVTTDKGGDSLVLCMSGRLYMTPALLGRAQINICIRMDIYAIDERTYNTLYKSRTTVGPVQGAKSGG
jgi:hypothetical protein